MPNRTLLKILVLTATLNIVFAASSEAAAVRHGHAQPLPALAAPAGGDQLSRAAARGNLTQAEAALYRAEALFHPVRAERAAGVQIAPASQVDATIVMRDLAIRQSQLSSADRARAAQILARPSDFGADPFGDGWSGPEAATSPDCDGNVCIHWTDTGSDAPTGGVDTNGIPLYVESALTTMGTVWNTEITQLGYRPPKSDIANTNNGGDGRLDIYLSDLGGKGLYGYCAPDDPNNTNPSYPYYDSAAYCAFDNDFRAGQFPTNTPLENLQVTAAHEFFHSVQFAYDAFDDLWFMEGTATWMEDVVYTDVNDNRQYLVSSQLANPGVSLDKGTGSSPYGSWIWFRFLTEYFGGTGNDLILNMWQRADGSPVGIDEYSLQAVRKVVENQGRPFATVYGDFAAWNRDVRRYDEGNAYHTGKASRFTLTGRRHVLNWHRVVLNHLSYAPVAIVPGRGVTRKAHLQIWVDLPNRNRGVFATAVVRLRNGNSAIRRFTLGRLGRGYIRTSFGRSQVTSVQLAVGSASTRTRCWRGSTWSCMGTPTDNGLGYWYVARWRR